MDDHPMKKLKVSSDCDLETMAMSFDPVEVDESLESRSMLVYGVESMQRMKRGAVLVSGLGGVGVEVAKNIALAGVRQLTLHDGTAARFCDLASQCFLDEDAVAQGQGRAAASAAAVQQLNPAVRVTVDSETRLRTAPDSFFAQFDCVILCNRPLAAQVAVDDACRRTGTRFLAGTSLGPFAWAFADFGPSFQCNDATGEPPIQVTLKSVSCDAHGVCRTLDGHRHNLEDGDVVQFRELRRLTWLNGQQRRVKVLCPFSFSVGDTTTTTTNSSTSQSSASHRDGEMGHGLAVQVKQPVAVPFQSLQEQLRDPAYLPVDFAKLDQPLQIHVALQALEQFAASRRRSSAANSTDNCVNDHDDDDEWDLLPRPWNDDDANELVELASDLVNMKYQQQNREQLMNERLVRLLAYAARGSFCPLASFMGGVLAQECLKSLSGKFHPLVQWIHLDCVEAMPRLAPPQADDEPGSPPAAFSWDSLASAAADCGPRGDRLDGQRLLLGQRLCERLSQSTVFMVGSGAIGCELLKCFALMSVSCTTRSPDGDGGGGGGGGQQREAAIAAGTLHITDPDHVEKSNLNRQFLFRSSDIGQSKSQQAAAAARRMNPLLNVVPALDRVGPETEDKYSDQFFQQCDVVVNALDNVQARLYVDERIVANQRPLLESGTLGTKGHVQVIVPFLTESYSSQRDPPEKDVPFCTLRSFPAKLEHTVEWARDFAFGGYFVSKPEQYNALCADPRLHQRLRTAVEASDGSVMADDGSSAAQPLDLKAVRTLAKLLQRRPQSARDCVAFARQRFQSYFCNKALQLLHNFPLDHTVNDQGTLFWTAPKRPPTPVSFNWDDPMCRSFVLNFARLWAHVWHLDFDVLQADSPDRLAQLQEWTDSAGRQLPEFKPKQNKHIETDETKTANDETGVTNIESSSVDSQLASWARVILNNWPVDSSKSSSSSASLSSNSPPPRLEVAKFEKDDDSNHHVDFMMAAANLRARMYAIDEGDRLAIKGIAGKIIPAIATTTAAVSGLVALELVKVVRGDCALDEYKNLFMNLALPFFTLTEPRACTKTRVSAALSTSIWDQWSVRDIRTLKDLVQHFKDRYGLTVRGVTHGARLIYMAAMPTHKKRLLKSVSALLKNVDPDAESTDLTIAFVDDQGEEVENAPIVKFYF